MEDANRDVLQERLAALEQTVAYQNRVGLVGLFAVLALLSLNYLAMRPSKDLVVDSLELRDRTGTVRSRLALNSDDSPMLSMFDHKGIKLATVGQTFLGSSALTFYDEGEPRIQLGSVSKGVSSLRFMNEANERLSSIYMRPDRGMGISIASADDGLFLGLEPSGKPDFRLVDTNEVRQGRDKLSSEDIERFALPLKGQPTKFADPRTPRAKTAGSPSAPVPTGTGAAQIRSIPSNAMVVMGFEVKLPPEKARASKPGI